MAGKFWPVGGLAVNFVVNLLSILVYKVYIGIIWLVYTIHLVYKVGLQLYESFLGTVGAKSASAAMPFPALQFCQYPVYLNCI